MAEDYAKPRSKRQFITRRISQLDIERSSFIPHWKELSEFISPRRGRFFLDDRNKGDKRYRSIINSIATQALKTARAGMVAGVANQSKKWFEVQTADTELMQSQNVRMWLAFVQREMEAVYNGTNFYSSFSQTIGELLQFGTGAMTQEEDDETVVHFTNHTIGSYWIGVDAKQNPNTFVRKFQMTVQQMVDEFGKENCSKQIRDLYDRGQYDQWFNVTHYIGDNPDYNANKATSKHKKIASCYFEDASNPGEEDKWLRESGYDEFPTSIPRWDITGEDIYGTDCPAMVALGDIKQLQIEERRKAQAIDKFVNPPLKGPTSLRNVPVSALPGGLTVYDAGTDREGLAPIYQVDPRITELQQDIQAIENRIKDIFFTPLFFAITQMEGIQPRNQLELNQRNQERLLILGPVLERVQTELQKIIERTFNIMMRKGLLPPAPPELAGQSLKVKFVSSLAMAQRSEQVAALNDLRTYVTELASGGFPEAVDKFNADQSIDEMGLILGAPPSVVRGDDEVEEMRQARMQQNQAEQQQQAQVQLTQSLIDRRN